METQHNMQHVSIFNSQQQQPSSRLGVSVSAVGVATVASVSRTASSSPAAPPSACSASPSPEQGQCDVTWWCVISCHHGTLHVVQFYRHSDYTACSKAAYHVIAKRSFCKSCDILKHRTKFQHYLVDT